MSQTSIDGLGIFQHALEAMGHGSDGNFDLLLRDNRVLCALPADSETALRTIELYQPQRWKGRLLKFLVQMCLEHGFRFPLLKTWGNGADDSGKEARNIGIMIGSTGHHCERAVAVIRSEDHWEVVKLAFGPDSDRILEKEAIMLKQLWAYPSVPEIRDYHVGARSARLHMTWQDGVPWHSNDISRVIGLLKCWKSNQEPRALAAFPEWNAIMAGLDGFPEWQKKAAVWADYRLVPSIRHGDLTRPNLRLSPSGVLWVHDWERGSIDGVPGLDLAHFLIQDISFRKSIPGDKVMKGVLRQLHSDPCKEWIRSIGWKDGPVSLLAATIAFNMGSEYFEHGDLLDILHDLSGNYQHE